ncbi:unnamed protein product [Acanthoscelides obtectus]|uniref:DNA oxidative demethylase ALKBH2 n=1 Tax=Acanthoscelides obtectus TaxID=200917 RepID=A0A9P0KE61_ACAOB|nr:unnamed protein product [Acanthoscelides obtectus]CAK1675309.1 DNA oxidative demethylase ALKBH2 [Acanthoscelides obtectus]
METKLDELQQTFLKISKTKLSLTKISGDRLDLDYGIVLPKTVANQVFKYLEDTIEYYEGELTQVRIFGKFHKIPRQQVAFGDDGLKYTFSGVTVPAKPWTNVLDSGCLTGHHYNFVLINRYRNGKDHIGEHRDAEKDLDRNSPIVSISLGQQRNFILKHGESRGKNKSKSIRPVKLALEHGSILLMNPPTNEIWYHSLPPCKTAPGVRINLTFRKIIE